MPRLPKKMKIAFPQINVVNNPPYRNHVPVIFRSRGWDHVCLSVFTSGGVRVGLLDVPAGPGAQWYTVRVDITATVNPADTCTLYVCPLTTAQTCNPTSPPTAAQCKRRTVRVYRP